MSANIAIIYSNSCILYILLGEIKFWSRGRLLAAIYAASNFLPPHPLLLKPIPDITEVSF